MPDAGLALGRGLARAFWLGRARFGGGWEGAPASASESGPEDDSLSESEPAEKEDTERASEAVRGSPVASLVGS